MAKFAKTGAEANAIAIRLARAYTKKNKIILCGYHGWHDWYLAAKFNPKSHMETHLFPKLKINGVPNLESNTSNINGLSFSSFSQT